VIDWLVGWLLFDVMFDEEEEKNQLLKRKRVKQIQIDRFCY